MSDIASNRGLPASSRLRGPRRAGERPTSELETDLAIDNLTDLRLLRAGRSASLFRAVQPATLRRVAVKVLHDELSSDTGQRFDRERRLTARLSGHSCIVPLFDTGITADDEPYLVMPFYRRGSLADLIGRYGPIAWREATFLLEPVAVTLAEVHSEGLVHRNIKPGNILLTDFLLPRVADFGMCLPIDELSSAATLIEVGHFGAPETAVPSKANPATDVFGLGAVLLRLLAGPHPDDEHSLTDMPGPVAELIKSSTADNPEDRPENAAAFVTALRRAVGLSETAEKRRANITPSEDNLAIDGGAPGPVHHTGESTSEYRAIDIADVGGPAEGEGGLDLPAADTKPTPNTIDDATGGDEPGLDQTMLWVLILVAVISTGILAMVAAAVLAVN